MAEGEVFNQEHRHSSLIATLREQWALGDPFTARDAAARTFSHAFTLDTPRDPGTWPVADPRPVPPYIQDALALGQALSTLGKAAFNGIRAYAEQHNIQIEGLPEDPEAETPPSRRCTLSITSSRSSSLCCTRPLPDPAPQVPDPGGCITPKRCPRPLLNFQGQTLSGPVPDAPHHLAIGGVEQVMIPCGHTLASVCPRAPNTRTSSASVASAEFASLH